MAVQRAGAAQAHLPRRHQADPEKLPQSGSSVLQLATFPSATQLGSANTCLWVLQVIILDPVQEYAAELLSVAEMFYANNIPLRCAGGDALVFCQAGHTCETVILLSAASVSGGLLDLLEAAAGAGHLV